MKDIKEVLELHEKWLKDDEGGIRANLTNADLTNVDLRYADLRYANLTNANLRYANLRYANLTNADLTNADLKNANLTNADLTNADLTNADLRYADLTSADLTNADLKYTNLRYANLTNANLTNANLRETDLRETDLRYANLRGVKYNYLSIGLNLVCPEEGSYIGYKKAKIKDEDEVIIKLLITEDALRSSATTRKCRCSKAKVLSITSLDNKKSYNEAYSNYDNTFIYRVNEIVEVKDFDTDRWDECSAGIHHFITRKEAVEY